MNFLKKWYYFSMLNGIIQIPRTYRNKKMRVIEYIKTPKNDGGFRYWNGNRAFWNFIEKKTPIRVNWIE
jgi:hypothetical protein